MYIKVDNVKYNNVKFQMIQGQHIAYFASTLPVFAQIAKIELFDNNNTKLRQDLITSYHRFESAPGYILFTNDKITEYKSAVDENNFYICQAKLEDGIIVYPIGQNLTPVNLPEPTMKQWAGDVLGFIKPKYDSVNTSWVEGATAEEQENWNAAHPKTATMESRIVAAEQAILALMNMQ